MIKQIQVTPIARFLVFYDEWSTPEMIFGRANKTRVLLEEFKLMVE